MEALSRGTQCHRVGHSTYDKIVVLLLRLALKRKELHNHDYVIVMVRTHQIRCEPDWPLRGKAQID